MDSIQVGKAVSCFPQVHEKIEFTITSIVNKIIIGKSSNRIFGKIWDFGPTEGGGSADPKFLSNFSRTNLTMVNGQKCNETHST